MVNSGTDSLGIRIIYINFIYLTSIFIGDGSGDSSSSKSVFDKMMDDTTYVMDKAEEGLTNYICSIASRSPGGLKPTIDQEVINIKGKLNLKNGPNGKSVKYPQITEVSETNILGFIDRGQVEINGVNESDLINLLGLLQTISKNDNNVSKLSSTNGNKCEDYRDPTYNNLDIVDVLYATIEDLNNQQRPFLLNFILCKAIGGIPNKSDYSDLWTIINTIRYKWYTYSGTFLTTGYIDLIQILVDLISIILMDPNAKNCVLTYLYGSRTNSNNINLGREYIQDELDEIINRSTINGVIETAAKLNAPVIIQFHQFYFLNFVHISQLLIYTLIRPI
jgi:hypothetical protein